MNKNPVIWTCCFLLFFCGEIIRSLADSVRWIDRRCCHADRVLAGAPWIPLRPSVRQAFPALQRDVDLLITFGGILSIIGRLQVDLKTRKASRRREEQREDAAAIARDDAAPEPAE